MLESALMRPEPSVSWASTDVEAIIFSIQCLRICLMVVIFLQLIEQARNMVSIQELNLIVLGHLSQPQLSIANDVFCNHSCFTAVESVRIQLCSEVRRVRGSAIEDLLSMHKSNLQLGAFSHHVQDVLKIYVICYSVSARVVQDLYALHVDRQQQLVVTDLRPEATRCTILLWWLLACSRWLATVSISVCQACTPFCFGL